MAVVEEAGAAVAEAAVEAEGSSDTAVRLLPSAAVAASCAEPDRAPLRTGSIVG